MINQDHISKSLETTFVYLNNGISICYADAGCRRGKIRIGGKHTGSATLKITSVESTIHDPENPQNVTDP
jgi:hypothetical protein